MIRVNNIICRTMSADVGRSLALILPQDLFLDTPTLCPLKLLDRGHKFLPRRDVVLNLTLNLNISINQTKIIHKSFSIINILIAKRLYLLK